MAFSHFGKEKSELSDVGLIFVKETQNHYTVKVKTIRCDNTGENQALHEFLNKQEVGVQFKYTAAGKPQHNGVVERKFATLYGRIRATMNSVKVTESMHKVL